MRNDLEAHNDLDDDGNPRGGSVAGVGLDITWQAGPVGTNVDGELTPNGALIEDVLEAALQRLVFLNSASDGKFACSQNDAAINAIKQALYWCDERTKDRETRKVKHTNQV